jgi:RNA polymerase sigma-70 factor (ECF subfamily)
MLLSVDDELVERARGGDRDAFSELLGAEARWAYGTARAITLSRADAEEAFQEATIRAWRDMSKLREPGAWRPWFRRIIVRAAIDVGRSRARVREVPVHDWHVQGDSSEQYAERDRVARLLNRMSSDERALLALRFGRDMTLAEAAKLLRYPLGTAKSRLHRALSKLRRALEDEADER